MCIPGILASFKILFLPWTSKLFFCHQCLDLLGMSKYCLAGGQQELVKLLAMSKFYNVFYLQKDFWGYLSFPAVCEKNVFRFFRFLSQRKTTLFALTYNQSSTIYYKRRILWPSGKLLTKRSWLRGGHLVWILTNTYSACKGFKLLTAKDLKATEYCCRSPGLLNRYLHLGGV